MKINKFFSTLALTAILFSSMIIAAFATNEGALMEMGNKQCIVSGDKVDGKHFVEYQGKRYGLCCRMCANKFYKDPEKYTTPTGKTAADSEKSEPEAAGEQHEDHHHD